MKKPVIISLLLAMLLSLQAYAQDSLSVLFLGNSYTSYNNLPQLVKDISLSGGKSLMTDASMPGGYTIEGHLTNATSLAKIRQGGWDYVVIQEQSQIPTIDYYRYNSMYSALTELKDTIEKYNPCAKLITYMTWGRRFGGQQCDGNGTYCSPNFADFNHMQDSLTSAYLGISESLNIQCAPVGAVWQNILNDTSLVLHVSDNSHPSLDGSYVAACAIFSSIWKLPVRGRSFPAGISAERAQYFQMMSDSTVFDANKDWNLFINKPVSDFAHSVSGLGAIFSNLSSSLTEDSLYYRWDFGDGNSSNNENPVHIYQSAGIYTVTLISSHCNFSDTAVQAIQVDDPVVFPVGFAVYPNPASESVRVRWEGGGQKEILILNSYGQLVRSLRGIQSDTRIFISDLASGVYLLRISDAENTRIEKIVISR